MKAVRLKALALVLVMSRIYAGLLFGAAGRLDVPGFWAVLGLWMAGAVTMILSIPVDLMAERMKPGPGAKERWIRPVLVLLFVAMLAVAGTDARYGVSDTVPSWLRIAGLVVIAAGIGLALWSQVSNPFFSSVVRLQEDRGQYVVSRGPYGWVRHPAYAAFTAMLLGAGLGLGSWISLALVPVIAGLLPGVW